MAFGIDDTLNAATAGVGLIDTLAKVIRNYRGAEQHLDLERLLEEIRLTALERIDAADNALKDFERTLVESGVDLDQSVVDVISRTSTWNPLHQSRLRRLRETFHNIVDSIYSAVDDIAALVRCLNLTTPMGSAVVESARNKHELLRDVLEAPSLRHALDRLRAEIVRLKESLMNS